MLHITQLQLVRFLSLYVCLQSIAPLVRNLGQQHLVFEIMPGLFSTQYMTSKTCLWECPVFARDDSIAGSPVVRAFHPVVREGSVGHEEIA